MNTPPFARIYFAEVMHKRLQGPRYRFSYRVFSLLLDIDRLEEAAAASPLFSHNRFNLLSFYDRNHGPRDGSPLRPWIETRLAEQGIDLGGGRIELLAFPSVLGYTFNPLSIWYCYHRDGGLRAVLCEVSNTFGESHGYLLHEDGAAMRWPVRQRRQKRFHVSPFIGPDAEYRFHLPRPEHNLQVVIQEYQADELLLVATQRGKAHQFNTSGMLRGLLGIPFLTFKVMALIHWNALKLFLRRAPFYRKPEPPGQEIS